jgi:hypothetical protein
MGRFNRAGGLPQDIGGAFWPQWTLLAYDRIQRSAIHKLHDYEGTVIRGRANVHDIDGIGVMNAACGPRFLFESLGNDWISRELGTQDLYSDSLTHQDMLGFVNDAHPAGPEAAFDAIFG